MNNAAHLCSSFTTLPSPRPRWSTTGHPKGCARTNSAMSALGQKQTDAVQKGMSALPPKADMCSALADVCFGPKADIDAGSASVGRDAVEYLYAWRRLGPKHHLAIIVQLNLAIASSRSTREPVLY